LIRKRGASPSKTALTRATLLKSALAEFLDNEFDGAKMAAIAERAGLAKGTAYRYFPTKEALFEAVVDSIDSGLAQPLDDTGPRRDEPIGDFLKRTLVPAVEQLEASLRADLARLVLSEGRKFPFVAKTYIRKVTDPTNAFIAEAARIAFDRGELSDDLLVRIPQFLIAPLWLSVIENGILHPERPLSAATLLSAQISLLFTTSGRRSECLPEA